MQKAMRQAQTTVNPFSSTNEYVALRVTRYRKDIKEGTRAAKALMKETHQSYQPGRTSIAGQGQQYSTSSSGTLQCQSFPAIGSILLAAKLRAPTGTRLRKGQVWGLMAMRCFSRPASKTMPVSNEVRGVSCRQLPALA